MENNENIKQLPECPRKSASFLSYLSFWWVLPILLKGYKKDLDDDDFYQPLEEHKSDYLGNKLCKSWEYEIEQYAQKGKKPSLRRATLRVFGWRIMGMGVVLFLIEFLFKISQPLFLGGLIRYYSAGGDKRNVSEAYMYAGAVIFCTSMSVVMAHPVLMATIHMGMKLRVGMCSMIYRKSLRLNKTALNQTSSGQVVNLMSNDVGRFDLAVLFVHSLWLGPLQTIVITYFMYREIGIAAIFGVLFLLAFIPFQAWLGKKISVLRVRTAQQTDERVRLMNEIIQGIQVIKMYGWEKPFGKLIELVRQKEIHIIRYSSYIRGIIVSFILFMTRVSVFISLVGYVLLGQVITAEKAFVIASFYNIIRQTMTVSFPQGIGQLAETLVSIKRIQKYMMYEEISSDPKLPYIEDLKDAVDKSEDSDSLLESQQILLPQKKDLELSGSTSHLSELGVVLNNIKSKWDTVAAEYTLNNINLSVQPETIVAVIGPVGAGKSSLIQSILGELQFESGDMKINGTISYASQEPWLFSSTIRQNILFGMPMERERYNEVIKCCALERDFELFPFGDKTPVGERGQSLSGGQKARINLARAVYRRATIYLLDDPLSAVDTHVGRHLFDQCVKGFLKDRIVILVTHQLQYLQNVDQIVLMEEGSIKAVGTYESLKKSGFDFANLMSDGVQKSGEQDESMSHSKESNLFIQQKNLKSMDEEKPKDNPMVVAEKSSAGEISWNVYKKYVEAGGGYGRFAILAALFILAQLLASGGDYYVTYWVNKVETGHLNGMAFNRTVSSNSSVNETLLNYNAITMNFIDKAKEIMDNLRNDPFYEIYVFTILIVATVIVTLIRSFHFFNSAMRSSKNLHNSMYVGVTQASMYFFNTNPSGRILNRFSKDIGQVDEILPPVMLDVAQIFLTLVGIVAIVTIVNYWLLLPIIAICVIFYYMRKFYLKSSRNIKRMEAKTRSPVYSHLSSSLTGLSTIRAFHAQKILISEFDNLQDHNSSSFYLSISTSRAFGCWLDVWCLIYIAVVTLSFFIAGDAYGGNVGLAISQVMGMTGIVQWGMRLSAELENHMTAVERVVEYQAIEAEGQFISKPNEKPPKEWPAEGHIKFDRVSLKYCPIEDIQYVLNDLEFEIQPKEKIGIVGRTGAGKSSLINALLRLSYNNGSITIDCRDTKSMGLHDLRSAISIIPQEPVLFSGSMRYNLDPFDEYTDDKLWRALDEVKLKDVVSELREGLQTRVAEGGSNFSIGQRQLVCLARTILRENKILVMDEATANVDPQTDSLIQLTIRNKFRDCTVLTIAHRLNTVMSSDKILVMDAGRVVEFGTPFDLLTSESRLAAMAKEMGKDTFESLLKLSEGSISIQEEVCQNEEGETPVNENHQEVLNEEHSENQTIRVSHRSTKEIQSTRLIEQIQLAKEIVEPTSYNEAISCNEKEHWIKAMQEEMDSLEKNDTCQLCDLQK